MALPIQQFYKEKSILKSYNFFVTIVHDDSGRTTYLPDREKIPEIKDYHVVDINLPLYEFKKEIMYYGPYARTFAVHNSDGYEFSMTLEEDDNGTVLKLINYLQKKIIKPNGMYVAPKLSRINQIFFAANNSNGNQIFYYELNNCYFLKASNPNFSYGSNESIKYEITFNCDFPVFFGG